MFFTCVLISDKICNTGTRLASVDLEDEVDPVGALALEADGDVAVAGAAVGDGGVSAVAVGLLVEGSDLRDRLGARSAERHLLRNDLEPGAGLLDDLENSNPR